MTANTRLWLHGLFAALIGGGASAVSAGFANLIVDPKDFNFSSGLVHLSQTMGMTFLVAAIMSVMAYLKQSPLPPEETAVKYPPTPSQGGS